MALKLSNFFNHGFLRGSTTVIEVVVTILMWYMFGGFMQL